MLKCWRRNSVQRYFTKHIFPFECNSLFYSSPCLSARSSFWSVDCGVRSLSCQTETWRSSSQELRATFAVSRVFVKHECSSAALLFLPAQSHRCCPSGEVSLRWINVCMIADMTGSVFLPKTQPPPLQQENKTQSFHSHVTDFMWLILKPPALEHYTR